MVGWCEATEAEPPFVVLHFRGTQQGRDWLSNLEAAPATVVSPKTGECVIGHLHNGFHDDFKSAGPRICKRHEADDVKGLPLYVAGHSLGGALAVVATWYLSSRQLAACYSFGAPRVGDSGLLGWCKTRLYRNVRTLLMTPVSMGTVHAAAKPDRINRYHCMDRFRDKLRIGSTPRSCSLALQAARRTRPSRGSRRQIAPATECAIATNSATRYSGAVYPPHSQSKS